MFLFFVLFQSYITHKHFIYSETLLQMYGTLFTQVASLLCPGLMTGAGYAAKDILDSGRYIVWIL